MEKRKRGRPVGSKDSTRRFRAKSAPDGSGLLSVEEQIRQLKCPARVDTLSAISGLSEAKICEKIEQGKLRAFKRSGIVLIEPKDFLEYWLQGRNRGATYDPALFNRRHVNVD